MNLRRASIVASQGALVAAVLVGSVVLVIGGGRDVPADAPFDDSAQAVAALDHAFDLAIALIGAIMAAILALSLRTWLRTGRWTLSFICDVGVGLAALLVVSPLGPTVGGLTTIYLLVLVACAAIAGVLITLDRPWNTWSGK